jgi:anti-sigma factor RsiW
MKTNGTMLKRRDTGCTDPGAVSPEELVAHTEGAAPARVAEHLRACRHCAAEAGRYAGQMGRLGRALFRFDCPSSHTLGEYALGLLGGDARVQVAAHVPDCPRCVEEMGMLRTFLSTEPAPQVGPLERLRRIVAALVPAPTGPAYAGLRGAAEATVLTYRTETTTITLRPGAAGRSGAVGLTGLILRAGETETVAGAEARLVGPSEAARTAEVDELGNFAFDDVPGGAYQLELRLDDEVVVVPDLRLGG